MLGVEAIAAALGREGDLSQRRGFGLPACGTRDCCEGGSFTLSSPEGPLGHVTSTQGTGAGGEEACFEALIPIPKRGAQLSPLASMSAKERQKGKVTKDSVTLLPCFYFVEVSGAPERVSLQL